MCRRRGWKPQNKVVKSVKRIHKQAFSVKERLLGILDRLLCRIEKKTRENPSCSIFFPLLSFFTQHTFLLVYSILFWSRKNEGEPRGQEGFENASSSTVLWYRLRFAISIRKLPNEWWCRFRTSPLAPFLFFKRKTNLMGHYSSMVRWTWQKIQRPSLTTTMSFVIQESRATGDFIGWLPLPESESALV